MKIMMIQSAQRKYSINDVRMFLNEIEQILKETNNARKSRKKRMKNSKLKNILTLKYQHWTQFLSRLRLFRHITDCRLDYEPFVFQHTFRQFNWTGNFTRCFVMFRCTFNVQDTNLTWEQLAYASVGHTAHP